MIAYTVLPRSMMKVVLGAFHGVFSGRYLGIKKNTEKVRQRHCWLHGRNDICKRGTANNVTTTKQAEAPEHGAKA
jgi:hypothetical protein